MKKIFFSGLMITLSVVSVKASVNQFNIVCELQQDTIFRIFSEYDAFAEKYLIFSGIYFRKVEAGNPAYCEQEIDPLDQSIILKCEDENSESLNYTLKFSEEYRSTEMFSILKTSKNSSQDEYKLCQIIN